MYQFRYTSTVIQWQAGNLVFAAFTIALFCLYTIYVLYLGYKYRKNLT